jgi:hypothetical protein
MTNAATAALPRLDGSPQTRQLLVSLQQSPEAARSGQQVQWEERNRRSGKPLSLLESRMARIAQNARKPHNGASEFHQLMLTLSQRHSGRLAEPPFRVCPRDPRSPPNPRFP